MDKKELFMNKKILLAMLAIALVFVLFETISAQQNVNTDPKSIQNHWYN
jgi:peptidoglycan hydrolase CwlO-like protein